MRRNTPKPSFVSARSLLHKEIQYREYLVYYLMSNLNNNVIYYNSITIIITFDIISN